MHTILLLSSEIQAICIDFEIGNKPQPPTLKNMGEIVNSVFIQLGNIGILFIGNSNQLRKTISLKHQNTLSRYISNRHTFSFESKVDCVGDSLATHNGIL